MLFIRRTLGTCSPLGTCSGLITVPAVAVIITKVNIDFAAFLFSFCSRDNAYYHICSPGFECRMHYTLVSYTSPAGNCVHFLFLLQPWPTYLFFDGVFFGVSLRLAAMSMADEHNVEWRPGVDQNLAYFSLVCQHHWFSSISGAPPPPKTTCQDLNFNNSQGIWVTFMQYLPESFYFIYN